MRPARPCTRTAGKGTSSARGSKARSNSASDLFDACTTRIPILEWIGRMIEPVAPAVHQLLDGKQRNQQARYRDRGIQPGHRPQGCHSQTPEPPQKIDIPKTDP